jgi:hypothetical protein
MVLSILYMDKNRSRFRNLQTSLRLLVTFCTPHLELMAKTVHFNCIHLFFRLPNVNVNLNKEFHGVFPRRPCHIEWEKLNLPLMACVPTICTTRCAWRCVHCILSLSWCAHISMYMQDKKTAFKCNKTWMKYTSLMGSFILWFYRHLISWLV